MGYIIVGVDGSPASRAAMDEAVRQARWRDASLLALHIVHMPTVGMYESTGFVDMTEEFERSGQRLLDGELADLTERNPDSREIEIESRLVMGHAGNELVQAARPAEGDPAELVVLGSRGFGGFRGLLLGSVTTYVIHHLACSVLVTPEPPAPVEG